MGQSLVRLGEDARTELAARDALVERVLEVLVGVERETLAHRDEEVDDLGEREVERGSGFVARPDQLVEIELRGGEVLVLACGGRVWARYTRPRTTCGTDMRIVSRLIP